jgi:hypothetical protein
MYYLIMSDSFESFVASHNKLVIDKEKNDKEKNDKEKNDKEKNDKEKNDKEKNDKEKNDKEKNDENDVVIDIINKNNDVVIDIKEVINNIEYKPSHSIRIGSTDSPNCKTIVKNMLKTRSRSDIQNNFNTTNTPESVIEYNYKYSPTLDHKQYEIGNIGNPDQWTDETVQQLIDFGDLCAESSNKCKKSSIIHNRISNALQISVILLGAISATTSIGGIDCDKKNIISVVSGCMVFFFSSMQGYFQYPQKSEIEANSCIELERMSRSIRIELSKSKELRVDPFRYIIKLENQREKILKRVGIEDN